MTIKTLEYIHNLLIKREAATCAEYDAALKLHREYENSETADETLVKNQADAACSCMKAHSEARDALKDFESVEW